MSSNWAVKLNNATVENNNVKCHSIQILERKSALRYFDAGSVPPPVLFYFISPTCKW